MNMTYTVKKHTHTHVGCLGVQKAGRFRKRAGVNEINITLSSCKQTSAFPTELPGARLRERK